MTEHSATAHSAREIATAWMSAVVAGDVETAIALSSSSILYTTGQVRQYEGHDGIRDIVADFRRMSGLLSVTLVGEILATDTVVALRRVEHYTLPSGGIEIRSCAFAEVDGGVVTRWTDYRSMETLDEVAG